MKKFAKGIAVVTGVVGVAAIAVGAYEKLTGKNIVNEAKKVLNDFENDDSDYDFGYEDDDYDEDDYDEDDFGSWDNSDDAEDNEDDSEFEPDDEDDSEEK